jgi:hypothetical protein
LRAKLTIGVCVAMLVLALLAVGCGTTAKKTTPKKAEDTGVVGVYVESAGGGGSVAFIDDGTFEGNAWGPEKKGTYTVLKSSGNNDVLVLKFSDSDATENWTVLTSGGKVVAVNSPKGVQYKKK